MLQAPLKDMASKNITAGDHWHSVLPLLENDSQLFQSE
jgi:hypothetical protein